jgi:hypothetical protein
MAAIIAAFPGLRPAQQTMRSDSSRKKPGVKNRSAPILPIPIRSLRTKWSQRKNKSISFQWEEKLRSHRTEAQKTRTSKLFPAPLHRWDNPKDEEIFFRVVDLPEHTACRRGRAASKRRRQCGLAGIAESLLCTA